jgi:hypothetical protein
MHERERGTDSRMSRYGRGRLAWLDTHIDVLKMLKYTQRSPQDVEISLAHDGNNPTVVFESIWPGWWWRSPRRRVTCGGVWAEWIGGNPWYVRGAPCRLPHRLPTVLRPVPAVDRPCTAVSFHAAAMAIGCWERQILQVDDGWRGGCSVRLE